MGIALPFLNFEIEDSWEVLQNWKTVDVSFMEFFLDNELYDIRHRLWLCVHRKQYRIDCCCILPVFTMKRKFYWRTPNVILPARTLSNHLVNRVKFLVRKFSVTSEPTRLLGICLFWHQWHQRTSFTLGCKGKTKLNEIISNVKVALFTNRSLRMCY